MTANYFSFPAAYKGTQQSNRRGQSYSQLLKSTIMKTICTTVYTFDELSDDAKKKAIESNRDINTHDDWFDAVYEDFKMICECLGIDLKTRSNSEQPCIWFSGFSSQGDGACFEAYYAYKAGSCKAIREHAPLDKKLHAIADNLKDIQKSNFYQLRAETSQYGHYYAMSVDVTRADDKTPSEHAEADIDCELQALAKWLYRSLEEDCNYLESEAAIIETLQENEYYFTAQGKMKNS